MFEKVLDSHLWYDAQRCLYWDPVSKNLIREEDMALRYGYSFDTQASYTPGQYEVRVERVGYGDDDIEITYELKNATNPRGGTDMNSRLAQAQARLRLAEEEYARIQSRPKEPIREGITIITWEKNFGKPEKRTYSYTAIRIEANGLWYTSIQSDRTAFSRRALTWDNLLDFIELYEDSMPEIWVATAYEQVL